MKKLIVLLLVVFTTAVFAQNNITNTLGTAGFFFVKDAGNTFFTIQQSDGFVGIGVAPATYKLNVNGAINGTSVLVNGVAVASSTDIYWSTGGSGKIYYSGGNVGIGTTEPATQLHTTGSVRFAGAGTPGAGKVLTSDADGTATWQTGATTLTIGQSYQGGIIFWLDATGQHGLIAATADQSTEIQWYNGSYTTTNAVRDGIGAGMYNTERIIANQGVGNYAAQLCANYQGGGYGDWYLPSKYELNLLYLQKTAVGGFASAYYGSSSESDRANAWLQGFGGGSHLCCVKNSTAHVRAVRAF